MTGDSKHIDKLFRDGLKGVREKPHVRSWDRLDHALDVARHRKRMLYYRLAAASVLILMAFGAGFFYASYLKGPVEVASEGTPTEISPETPDRMLTETPPISTENTEDAKIVPGETEALNEQGNQQMLTPSQQVQQEEIADAGRIQPMEKVVVVPPTGHNLPYGDRTSSPINEIAFLQVSEISLDLPVTERLARSDDVKQEVNYSSLFYYPEDYAIKPPSNDNKWSVGAQFAPTYSYRDISANYGTNLSNNQDLVDELNNIEDALLSYAGGVDVGYNFSKKWSVQSGVYFSRIGQVNSDALQFKQGSKELLLYAINTSTGRINVAFDRVPDNVRTVQSPKDSVDMGSINNAKVIQNFDLFEVPLLIRYKLLNKKFSMNLTGGLSPAYLMGNNTYLEMEDQKYDVGDAGNLNSMIVNTSLGVGFEYLVTKKLSVNFEPTFKYSLNPINNNSSINYHPYYFSWFTGVRLKIN